jgi:hypothetical protein
LFALVCGCWWARIHGTLKNRVNKGWRFAKKVFMIYGQGFASISQESEREKIKRLLEKDESVN